MKILLYSMNFWPEPIGIGKYSGEMAFWLAGHGHEIRVICGPPYYPEWRIADGYSAFRYCNEIHQGVDIRRCPAWIPARPSGWKRVLCMLLFGASCLWEAMKSVFWCPDVVIVVEPPISCVPVARFFSLLGNAKSWLHIQDFEVDAAIQLGMLGGSVLRKPGSMIERFLIRRFDRCSTISKRMLEKLVDKSGDASSSLLFPNWVDCDEIFPLPQSSFREWMKLEEGQQVALYAGNIGRKQGLEVLVDAARLLQEQKNLTFVICGRGAAYPQIHALTKDLPNIKWLPVQPVEKLNELLNLADIHLLPQLADAADLVMPSKLTGMLASGRAVLATADPGTQVYDLVIQVGRVVPPAAPEKFAQALVQMLASPERLREHGRKARRIAEESLSREIILKQFEQQLRDLVASPVDASRDDVASVAISAQDQSASPRP